MKSYFKIQYQRWSCTTQRVENPGRRKSFVNYGKVIRFERHCSIPKMKPPAASFSMWSIEFERSKRSVKKRRHRRAKRNGRKRNVSRRLNVPNNKPDAIDCTSCCPRIRPSPWPFVRLSHVRSCSICLFHLFLNCLFEGFRNWARFSSPTTQDKDTIILEAKLKDHAALGKHFRSTDEHRLLVFVFGSIKFNIRNQDGTKYLNAFPYCFLSV